MKKIIIMKYKITTILLSVLSVILFALTIYYKNTPQVKYETVTQNDTILIKSIDTITVTKKDIVYKETLILDTIYIKDTAMLVEQKIYSDSLSTIFISGIEANLDSIFYRLPKDTVIVSSEKIQTVKEQESFWNNRFTISAGLFAGYGLVHRQPDVFLGVGCAVRLY